MLMNSRYAAAWAKTFFVMVCEVGYVSVDNYGATKGGIWLCTGAIPTYAEVSSMNTGSTRLTNFVVVKYAACTLTLPDSNGTPPAFSLALPAAVAATAVGTITWAAILSGGAATDVGNAHSPVGAVVDVSMTGGTGALQVDNTTVSTVGQKITLTGFTFKPWRV